ncbi:MAG: small-conductance mechanosensitive channel [Candidatus Poriferisodalaceae bacterium]|jgi:moderate conductance mechanosensitive channel
METDLLAPSNIVLSGGILLAAAIATRLAHLALGVTIRRGASRALAGKPSRVRWRIRSLRSSEQDDSLAEMRRSRRIDATALAFGRLATVLIWITTLVVLLHVHGISVSVAIGGAGFVGLVLALGAQTSVSDYVTGLHILLEDRFGEGDEIEVTTPNGRQLRGVVVGNGMFGTRIQSDGATHHVANRVMSEVTNHSQLGVTTVIEIEQHLDSKTVAKAAQQLRAARPDTPEIFVEQITNCGSVDEAKSRIRLRAVRALGETDQHHLSEELTSMLDTAALDHRKSRKRH